MKLKRLGALTAAMALTLSITTLPAAAADFKDVQKPVPGVQEGHWAYEHIMKMSNLGLAGGYPDGTFKPEGKMTAAECLLFCARTTGIDTLTKSNIAQDHADELKKILPADMYPWSFVELSLDMEAGVLSLSELEALAKSGALAKTITRENICLYLVRAMQLEPLAKSLTTYSMNFTDVSDIAPALRPYVYVLNNFGIINGVEGNRFDPHGKVTRAQMTTMLSRAVSFISNTGITVELSEYTDYDWKGGVITSVSPSGNGNVLLTLDNKLTGEASYTLVEGVKVYKDNMVTSFTDLKPGQYVRLNQSPSGAIREARLGGPLTTYTGTITALDRDSITITVNGTAKTYEIDRFTQLASGSTPITREKLDLGAGYTAASCYVDSMGHLAGVQLSGGTRLVSGILKEVKLVNGVTTIGVSGSDGVIHYFELTSGTNTTVDAAIKPLTSSLVGSHVTLRADNESGKAVSVTVDTVTRYHQGSIQHLNSSNTKLHILDRSDDKEYAYPIDDDATITYQGQPISRSHLETGWYATIKVVDKIITEIEAFPGSVTVEGTLESISFGTTTVLKVKDSDGGLTTFNLDIKDLPDIYRDKKYTDPTQLRVGDKVVITVRYNEVTKVEATSQTASITGVIQSISHTMDGAELELKLEDGTVKSYVIREGVSITKGDISTNVYALKPGFTVGLVTSGSTVVAVEITSTVSSTTQLNGTIYAIHTAGDNPGLTVLVKDDLGNQIPVTVSTRNANILHLGGYSMSLSNLELNDPVQCMGSYNGATFVATIVIRMK